MAKIKTLTAEQKSKFPEYVKKWTDIGLSTDPADRPRAEKAIKWMYEQSGLEEPKIIWTGSPIGNLYAKILHQKFLGILEDPLKILSSEKKYFHESVVDLKVNTPHSSVQPSLDKVTYVSVLKSVYRPLLGNIWREILSPIRTSVGDKIGDEKDIKTGESLKDSMWRLLRQSAWSSIKNSVGPTETDNIIISGKRESEMSQSVWNTIFDSVEKEIRESVGQQTGESLKNDIRDPLKSEIPGAMRDDSGKSVEDEVWAEVINSSEKSILNKIDRPFFVSILRYLMNSKGSSEVARHVQDSLWEDAKSRVEESILESVKESVTDAVMDSVREESRKSVREKVLDEVTRSIRDSILNIIDISIFVLIAESISKMPLMAYTIQDSLQESVKDKMYEDLKTEACNLTKESCCEDVWTKLRNPLLRLSVLSTVIWGHVMDEAAKSIKKEDFSEIIYHHIFGQHDAYWLGYYEFFRNELGLIEETDPLQGLTELCQSAGWCLPYKNVCFMSERHSKLNRDSQGRLHSETEPAVEYPDGWKIYAIHGVSIPEYIIISPEKISVELIEKEENVEVRRVMINRYKDGAKSYLKDSGAILIDEQKDINSGLPIKLWKKPRKDDSDLVMIEMLNKTKEPDDNGILVHKSYYIRVRPDIRDVIEAVAWHHNQSKEDYLLTQRGT